ncbi:MAG: diguanylate cyclase domain-containing protein [Alphaproteobacteria bacterium]
MTTMEGVTVQGAVAQTATAAHSADKTEIRAAVQAETTRLLYRTPTAILVNLINGAIFVVAMWRTYPPWVTLLWIVLLYAVVAIRLLNWRSYRRGGAGSGEDARWARRFALGALATGALWGVGGVSVLAAPHLYYIVFVAFVIGGMTAGAIAQHSVYLPALFCFLLPAVLPLAGAFIIQGTTISIAMGLMTAIYAGALALLGRDLNRSLVRNFRLHAEFKSLTGNLEQEITRRKHAEVELAHLARHDALTGLANRATFFERLKLEIGRAKRGETRFAVHYIDLDHFKDVNDTYGHQMGDRLLALIAEQLEKNVRQIDLVARLGGDEFAILQDGIHNRSDAETLATKLLDQLSDTFEIDGNHIRIAPSIGIALYHADAGSADMILEQADLAMYQAKSAGRRCYRWYDAAPAAKAAGRP